MGKLKPSELAKPGPFFEHRNHALIHRDPSQRVAERGTCLGFYSRGALYKVSSHPPEIEETCILAERGERDVRSRVENLEWRSLKLV